VHESSYVDDGATIGERTKIWHFCHITSGASIGTDCSLGQNVFVARNVRIGNHVKIQNNVSVYEGATPRPTMRKRESSTVRASARTRRWSAA
jgi:UDP-2-acetamido-3-amino-2,3-dideoxy-glucuronate N-acetyltransferase